MKTTQGWCWMTQIITTIQPGDDEQTVLKSWSDQEGCVKARLIGGAGVLSSGLRVGKERAVQAFFSDHGEGVLLPDGCRRVLVSDAMVAQL
jgi:hypothetical protein